MVGPAQGVVRSPWSGLIRRMDCNGSLPYERLAFAVDESEQRTDAKDRRIGRREMHPLTWPRFGAYASGRRSSITSF
jgi:hypothetical protein